MTKSLLVLPAIALLCTWVTACDGTGKRTGSASQVASGAAATGNATGTSASSTAPTQGYLKGDSDVDDEYGEDNPNHSDDPPLREYGHAASAVDRRAITALVRRYYATAAARNGVAACSLVYAGLTKDPGLTKTVPEDHYAPTLQIRVSRGERCAQVTSRLFEQNHQSLVAEATTLRVTGVRVRGRHAVAMLGFRTTSERWIPVTREGGAWRIGSLLARELP